MTTDETTMIEQAECLLHPGTRLVCLRCAWSKIGKMRTKKKAKASRENGKLGGRPKAKRHRLPKLPVPAVDPASE